MAKVTEQDKVKNKVLEIINKKLENEFIGTDVIEAALKLSQVYKNLE